MSSNIEELKKMAKFHKYFWNGLFVALYEPHRKRYPVVSLAVPGGKYFIPMSESTIKNYLTCKTRMNYDTFLVFCHGIKIDIEKKRILELMPYIERAGAYLDEMVFSGKISRSKTKRQQVFSHADALSDEGHLWEKQLVQDEKERAEMMELFSNLSQEELSLLYQVADGYPFTCEWDDRFMDCYCRLNENGKSIFREALDNERKRWNISYHDEFCGFCRDMALSPVTLMQDATPEMLYGKLEKADFYFQPEDAQNLLKYRNAEPDTWQTLNAFHQLIFSYPEENIEGQTFTEQESLLIFLYWLISVPSLCR